MTWRELMDDDVEHASVDCRCNYADHHSTLGARGNNQRAADGA